ncbi:unnamed protein product [Peniophora sp. CBMAI 1063]|nr:unnamed protein product [Peniophora sp. CBMAI 1063]
MSSNKDFTVAIVGGGFVGLTCAIELAKSGVHVEVFEAASGYGDVGAGINIGPNAYRVLEAMGIVDDVKAVLEDQGPPMSLVTFVKGEDVRNVVYQYPDDKRTNQGFGVHRGYFLKALARILPDNVVSHLNKRATTVTTLSDGRVRVDFADGSEHFADVVIGADGIKSTVRAHVFDEGGDRLVDTLCRAYRTLVPMQRLLDAGINPKLLEPHTRCWMGNGKYILMYPISSNTMLNIAAFVTDYSKDMVPAGPQSSWSTWVRRSSRDEFIAAYSDYGPDALAILNCVENVNKWDVHGIYPALERTVARAPEDGEAKVEGTEKANTVIVGDAAHPMLPHLGAGAGVGIEDAFVLARLLAHPQTKRENIGDILRAYETVRLPRGAYVANASRRAGSIYQGHGPSGPDDAGRKKDLDLQWEETWEHDARNDVAKAVEALVEGGVFMP